MAKEIILGFGIALTIAALIHFGIKTLYPAPEWQRYQIKDYFSEYQQADENQQRDLAQTRAELNRKFLKDKAAWSESYFYWAVPVALVTLLVAGMVRNAAVSAGLIGGALISLIGAYARYWSEITSGIKFLSLCLVLVVLLLLSYDKLVGLFDDGEDGAEENKRVRGRKGSG